MTDLLGDPSSEKSERAMEAMLKMKRIDMAEVERAAGAQPAGAR